MAENFDPIEDLLEQLEQDESKNDGKDFHNIVKIQMAYPDNHGMIMIAPFQGTVEGKKSFYTLVPGVCEFKCRIPSVDNGNSDTWIRIMPKEFYGTLTEDEEKLYDTVKNLYDQVRDKHTEGDAWKVVRIRSYSLFYGKLLKHVNKEQKEITDNYGKDVLIIFPSRNVVNELGKAIKAKTNALNGNRAWVSDVFDATNSKRAGVLVVSFDRPESGAYNASVSFEFNSNYSKVVEPHYDEEEPSLFQDPVADFLGRFNGKDGHKFNADLFKEFGKALTIELKGAGAAPAESPAPENKNGKDPVLSPTEAPTVAPTPAPMPAPAAPVPGVDKLPF
jgi:hypothetical protein